MRRSLVILLTILVAGCAATPPPSGPGEEAYSQAIALIGEDRYGEAEDLLAARAAVAHPTDDALLAQAICVANSPETPQADRVLAGLRKQIRGGLVPMIWHLRLLSAERQGDERLARSALAGMLDAIQERAEAAGDAARTPADRAPMNQAFSKMVQGREALLEGRTSEAVGYYTSAMDLWPDSPHLKLCLSESLRRFGDPATAAEFLRSSIETTVRDPAWQEAILKGYLRFFTIHPTGRSG